MRASHSIMLLLVGLTLSGAHGSKELLRARSSASAGASAGTISGLATAFSRAEAEASGMSASGAANAAASAGSLGAGSQAASRAFARATAASGVEAAAQAAAQAIAKSYSSALATAASVAHAFTQASADVEVLTKCWVLTLSESLCKYPVNTGAALAVAFSDALAYDAATCGQSCAASKFALATVQALAEAVDACGCQNPSLAIAQALAELGPDSTRLFLEAIAVAADSLGIQLPACLFPISCVYVAPYVVSHICRATLYAVLAKCNVQPKVVYICGKAGLPVKPEQAVPPARAAVSAYAEARASAAAAAQAAAQAGVSGNAATASAIAAAQATASAGGFSAVSAASEAAARVRGASTSTSAQASAAAEASPGSQQGGGSAAADASAEAQAQGQRRGGSTAADASADAQAQSSWMSRQAGQSRSQPLFQQPARQQEDSPQEQPAGRPGSQSQQPSGLVQQAPDTSLPQGTQPAEGEPAQQREPSEATVDCTKLCSDELAKEEPSATSIATAFAAAGGQCDVSTCLDLLRQQEPASAAQEASTGAASSASASGRVEAADSSRP